MARQPGGDIDWATVLAHRAPELRFAVRDRFLEIGIRPEQVNDVLVDLGRSLAEAMASAEADWADRFGGHLAVALLAAEVSAYAAHLNSRASTVRAHAVDALLEEYSAVTVAARLGVSRQKVYEIARGGAQSADRSTGETDG